MRGEVNPQAGMFSYISRLSEPKVAMTVEEHGHEQRIANKHPA